MSIALISLQAIFFEHNCSVHSFDTYRHLHLEVAPSELVFGLAAGSSYRLRKPTKSFASGSFASWAVLIRDLISLLSLCLRLIILCAHCCLTPSHSHVIASRTSLLAKRCAVQARSCASPTSRSCTVRIWIERALTNQHTTDDHQLQL